MNDCEVARKVIVLSVENTIRWGLMALVRHVILIVAAGCSVDAGTTNDLNSNIEPSATGNSAAIGRHHGSGGDDDGGGFTNSAGPPRALEKMWMGKI